MRISEGDITSLLAFLSQMVMLPLLVALYFVWHCVRQLISRLEVRINDEGEAAGRHPSRSMFGQVNLQRGEAPLNLDHVEALKSEQVIEDYQGNDIQYGVEEGSEFM